jgi:hypothetical protein
MKNQFSIRRRRIDAIRYAFKPGPIVLHLLNQLNEKAQGPTQPV